MTVMQVDACARHIEGGRRLSGGAGVIGIDAGGVCVGRSSAKFQYHTGTDTMVTHRALGTAQRGVASPLDAEGKSIGKSRHRCDLKRKLGGEVMNIDLILRPEGSCLIAAAIREPRSSSGNLGRAVKIQNGGRPCEAR